MREVVRTLPDVVKIMEGVFILNEKIDHISKDIDNLIDIWGEELFDQSHMDNKMYQERMKIRNEYIMGLKEKIDAIQNFGCIVKNIDEGIIDFPSTKNGKEIHFCWKYGEKAIEHWHAADESDSERKSVRKFVLNNSK
jgi:hypothetical protein